MKRRTFLTGLAASAAAGLARPALGEVETPPRRSYTGPNVIIVRFGGGVRRRETIASDETYAPFLKKVLAPQGVLFPELEIANGPGIVPSHGQGTLYILTGRYDRYEDVDQRFLGERFEPKVPTLFEAFRKAYDVPEHQALMVNGEDRINEEFYTFSNHHLFGVHYRATVLSLYRFKLYLLRTALAQGKYEGAQAVAKQKELKVLESKDIRSHDSKVSTPALDGFWSKWAEYYGGSGLVNPRGDRLLTELGVRAMRLLQPRLMMINYNDPDYVHWGNKSFYTRGISVVDEGLMRLFETAQVEPAYRDNTVFIVVPDCGRDSNPFMAVPYQHHSNTKSAHEIFMLAVGPGIDRGRVVDKHAEQNGVAATVAGVMGFSMPDAEGQSLAEAFA
jgi:hypothetical protein